MNVKISRIFYELIMRLALLKIMQKTVLLIYKAKNICIFKIIFHNFLTYLSFSHLNCVQFLCCEAVLLPKQKSAHYLRKYHHEVRMRFWRLGHRLYICPVCLWLFKCK